MHTKTSESTISHLVFIYFVCGKEFWDIGNGLGYGYTKENQRLHHCIFTSTSDIWDFGNEATAGKGLDWHWIPEGGGP